MGFWVLKTEPETYSWDDLLKAKKARWDGVRNFAAAKNLRAMRVGDEALIYHSGEEKAVVGIARVAKAAYADPTAKEGNWVAVDLVPVRPLAKPVTLAAMKADPVLKEMVMVRQGRLSVSPVTEGEWKRMAK